MNNVFEFPGQKDMKNTPPLKKKKNYLVIRKSGMVLVEILRIVTSPFLGVLLFALNKISTLLLVCSTIMAVVFYNTAGVHSKYFMFSLAYVAASIFIKYLCNKKGR